jgi:protease IV
MRRFLLRLFAAIGVIAVLIIVLIGVALWRLTPTQPTLPQTIVLTADLGKGLAEGPRQDPLSAVIFGAKPSLRGFLDALDRAAEDPRVKGIYVHIDGDALGLAKIQEVRDAILEFRRKGKFAIAFSESFGEFGPGTRPYYLATAFDEIWLQPMGAVGLVGLRAEVPFFRGLLDRIGLAASFDHREEYKSAMNSLTESGMTGPQREEIEALLNAMAGQIVSGIAAARNLPEADVAAAIDRGPLFAEEAKAARLIDHIGYRDEAVVRARQRAGSGAELVSLSHYLRGAGDPHSDGPTIALIYGTGLITQGNDAAAPLAGPAEMNARDVAAAFRAAFRDADVRAIVFRIDSPGGSAIASETIWREVTRARERGKPVIVSMGDTAGSGGYYIAAPADKIVAEPATITGSIGVVAGKLVVAELLRKLGITTDSVERGRNAAMFSALHDFSPAERERLTAFLDLTYRGFKDHVAAGRHLSPEAVEAVAKGRVWSGQEAKDKGLIDELGGYAAAFRLAKEAAKIPPDAPFKLVVFPHRKSAAEIILARLLDGDSDGDGSASGATAVGHMVARLGELIARLDGMLEQPGPLQMPPIGELR